METTCGGSSMKHIKTWSERCEEHPDHQERIISERMIQARMQEEIDELRRALETEQKTSPSKREWVELTIKEVLIHRHLIDWTSEWSYLEFAREIEKALKEKNHG